MNSSFGLRCLLEKERKETAWKEKREILCWLSRTQHDCSLQQAVAGRPRLTGGWWWGVIGVLLQANDAREPGRYFGRVGEETPRERETGVACG